MNKKPFYKGILPEDEEEVLHFFRIDSIHDLAARLCQVPEEDLWNLMREILLALRSRIAFGQEETPYLRAIEYLYTLNRFVEISKRYPSKTEQGRLFEELTSQNPIREDRQIAEVVKLLQIASRNPENRKAIRQLKEKSRKYRDSGLVLKDSPDISEDE